MSAYAPGTVASRNKGDDTTGSPDSRRGYQHAINDFAACYCSEPQLAFSKTVVLRYRFHLEQRGSRPGRSSCAWLLCDGWLTRRLTPVYSAPNSSSRGTLGHTGSYWQAKAHTNRSRTELGEREARGLVNSRCWHRNWSDIPIYL